MSDVTLSAAVRQSLLSLQNTTGLIERTQDRLSTGLKVAGAIDDPVAFFQAKSLNDRASDFLEKKDAIDQGISTVTSALDGVEGIEALVNQLKGVSNSMKSATDAQIADLVSQFNDLRTQINNLATDASYQGTNLINGTGQTLSVEFSEKTASLLNVASVDLTVGTAGLNVAANAYFTGDDSVTHAAIGFNVAGTNTIAGNRYLSNTGDFTITYQGSQKTFSAGETISFTYGTGSTFNFVNSTQGALTLSQGEAVSVQVATSTTAAGVSQVALVGTSTINLSFSYAGERIIVAGGGASAVSAITAISALSAGGAGTSALTAQTARTARSAGSTAVTDNIAITYQGNNTITLTSADNVFFSFGTGSLRLQVETGSTLVLSANKAITISVLGAGASGSLATGGGYVNISPRFDIASQRTQSDTLKFGVQVAGGATGAGVTANGGELTFTGLVKAGDTTRINAVIDQLDSALTTLRTNSQTLGTNVALLNTRLDFTTQYTNTLEGGAAKLTLADINEEGANLLALQTRQQLGIQSLSLAAQAEASILSLFG